MSVEVDIMSPTSDQNAKSLSSRWESKMKTHQLKDNVWRYEAGKTTKEKIYYLLSQRVKVASKLGEALWSNETFSPLHS